MGHFKRNIWYTMSYVLNSENQFINILTGFKILISFRFSQKIKNDKWVVINGTPTTTSKCSYNFEKIPKNGTLKIYRHMGHLRGIYCTPYECTYWVWWKSVPPVCGLLIVFLIMCVISMNYFPNFSKKWSSSRYFVIRV